MRRAILTACLVLAWSPAASAQLARSIVDQSGNYLEIGKDGGLSFGLPDDAAGTPLTAYNRNANGPDMANAIYADSTFTDAGTVVYQAYLGELGGPGASDPGAGGSIGQAVEWILAPGATYVLEVETLEDDVIVFFEAEVYDAATL